MVDREDFNFADACYQKDLETVNSLVKEGADIKQKGKEVLVAEFVLIKIRE